MEEGEILEVSEKEVVVQRDKHKASDRAQEKKSEKIKSETVETKPLFKSINIVGYASDDEEEEGEVRDKIVKKDEKSSSQKHKRKDKKRESRKRRKDTISDSSSTLITNSRPEKKVVSTAIVTPVQKVASQEMSVVAAVVKPETNKDDDDVDIDFDVDDIDRALEVALEKKLDKKKLTKPSNVEQEAKTDDKENSFQDESIHNLPSGEPAPKQITSSTAIFQAKNLDTNVSEPISDKDSTSHPIKKTINEIETVCEQDDEKILTEIKEMAELALNKLEFLDISTDSLSRLQVLFIELQTRHTDWTAGGLSTHYFYEQLKTAQGLLEQYELSAVPEGWACQWDRANNRYYYRNSATNRIQWEYPEVVTSEAVEEESVAVSNEKPTNKVSDRGSEEHHRSRGSGGSSSVRYRKRDEKEKNKRDKRSNSRHYHRKRRRGRDQSNSSNSSGESQQHRRHRKSKKKKRHRTERSPSVEILENTDGMDDVEIIGTPSNMPQPASPPVLPDIASDVPASSPHSVTVDSISEIDVTSNAYVSQPPVEDGTELNLEVEGEPLSNTDNTIMEEAAEVVNTAVITKPPQIVVPPQIAAALNPDDVPPGAAVADLYSTSQLITSAPGSFYSSYAVAPPTEQAIPSTDMHIGETNHETSMETDKSAKKKKKDKKSLTTGSSIMMKKKHMSSMVQKWQKVKIEVEKEDRAKELRQAAIRKKIEELKSSDNKQS
uniref:WW domain-containing protein n=2 Tax=Arion vulgaris TaxID=1028688 RepID=A0A0B7B696_9EUPU